MTFGGRYDLKINRLLVLGLILAVGGMAVWFAVTTAVHHAYMSFLDGGSEEAVSRARMWTKSIVGVGVACMYVSAFGILIRTSRNLKAAADEHAHNSMHDHLTGLPNRARMRDGIETRLQRASRHGAFAVLLMDLDGFKEVNDSLGHHRGDLLLQDVADRLSACVGDENLLVRLGGDEFAVVTSNGFDALKATRLAETLCASLRHPFDLDGNTVDVGSSVGVAMYPEHGQDPHQLLKNADVAMYLAKASQCGVLCYDADRDENSPARLSLVSQLRHSIATNRMVVEYQPIRAVRRDEPVTLEALVRWRHPDRGLLQPGDFVSLAERAGLASEMTTFVLRRAITDCSLWLEDGLDVNIAVNIFPANLLDSEFTTTVRRMLENSALDPARLQLEITDRSGVDALGSADATLASLADLGVRLAIDDFGVGAWSLADLRALPISVIKIDQEFFEQLTLNPDDRAIVQTTTELAHRLGLVVVAEGIENEAARAMAVECGVDYLQGFAISDPLPADVIPRVCAPRTYISQPVGL